MTWVKLDDGFSGHPKVIGLSDAAFRLHICALCYASTHLTDGQVPRVWVPKSLRRVAEQLAMAGLWTEHNDGYTIHDYLEYQPSRAQVTQQRSATAARVKRHRNAVTGQFNQVDHNATVTALVTPAPSRPVPSREDLKKERICTSDDVPVRPRASSALVISPARYEKLQASHAFVGSRLRVPHVLHEELRTKLGGDNPEAVLQAWYLLLNEQAEESREPIADVFEWLRPKFVAWATAAVFDAEIAKMQPRGAR